MVDVCCGLIVGPILIVMKNDKRITVQPVDFGAYGVAVVLQMLARNFVVWDAAAHCADVGAFI